MVAFPFLLMHISDETVIEIKFWISKSKVEPIKQLIVPKTELEAATIGARFLSFASEELLLNRRADFNFLERQSGGTRLDKINETVKKNICGRSTNSNLNNGSATT